jgi:hypothetical protein
MTTAKIIFNAEQKGLPLYCQYQGQHNPQPAYVTLDLDNGEINADYSGEIGNGMPMSVWNGVVRRYPIHNLLNASQIQEILEENLEAFQKIVDNSSVEWDGSNWIGKVNQQAHDIEGVFEDGLGYDRDTDNVVVMIGDWLTSGGKDCWLPTGDAKQFLEELRGLESEYAFVEDIVDTCVDLWVDHLYCGELLPQSVAQFLLEDGRCEGTTWFMELNAYAQGMSPEEYEMILVNKQRGHKHEY